ncbi:hypothetical protein ABW54_18465 [Burkholderia cenocepacia]|nr:hypothetical protein ABW54_18465 [Burkholderia cenocepacia]
MRGSTWPLPLRARRQFAQLQFHCGSPPPAPEPSILIFMASAPEAARADHGETGGTHGDQRLAMYIVISKPKRRSV